MRNIQKSKHRRLRAVPWTGLLILIVAGIALVVGVSVISASAAQGTKISQATRPIPLGNLNQYAPGVAAIKPHLATSSGTAPTFTATDAEQYVTAHPFANTNVTVIETPTVIQATFMTSAALSAQLDGESIGRPDTALVCYVKLQGTFLFMGPKGPLTTHIAYEVFDAETGNLILAGGQVQ